MISFISTLSVLVTYEALFAFCMVLIELCFAPIVVGNPQFNGAQNEQMRAAFAKFGIVKFK